MKKPLTPFVVTYLLSAYCLTQNSSVSGEWAEEEVGGWADDTNDAVEAVHWLDMDLAVTGKDTLSGLEGLWVNHGGKLLEWDVG